MLVKDILIYYSIPLIVVNVLILAIAKFDAIKDGIACSKVDQAAKTGEAQPFKDLWHFTERAKELFLVFLGVFIGLLIGGIWFRGFLFSPVLMIVVGLVVTGIVSYYAHYCVWNNTFLKRDLYLIKEDTWKVSFKPKWLEKLLGFHH